MSVFTRTAADTGATIVEGGLTRTVGSSRYATDAYTGGASATFGAATLATGLISAFADAFDAYAVPEHVDVFYIARLPQVAAQQALTAGQTRRGVLHNVKCSWHGRILDPERGAFAVVRASGELEDLVGSRVVITTRAGVASVSVVAYISNVADLDERDEISVARNLFLDLSALGDDRVLVSVQELVTL